MKTKLVAGLKKQANTLLATLALCLIFGMSTLGYLSLVRQQNAMSVRSQNWNLAMTMVEAGIEEGLEHLNSNHDNLQIDPWVSLGDANGSVYLPTRSFNGGSYRVFIYLTNNIDHPVVLATATVNVSAFASANPFSFLASASVDGSTMTVQRAVLVKAYRNNPFGKAAIGTRGTINMNGNNVVVDSFDSEDPSKSTNGLYSSALRDSQGNVLSDADIANAVSVGNANIYGKVSVGPNGTVSVGQNGAVGDMAWQQGHTGIQPGWSDQTANFVFPETTFPFTSGFYPSGGNIVVPTGTNSSSRATNSTTYPSPPPSSVVGTNSSTVFLPSWTNNPPPGYRTNYNATTSVTLPNPLPPPVITTNKASTTTATYPAAGTYVGSITTNWYGGHNKIQGYTYLAIQSYSYTNITYSYTAITYSWTVFSTNTVFTTNTFDHILYGGDYYYSGSYGGKTYVAAPSRLVVNGSVDISGSGSLTLAKGATIQIWTSGPNIGLGTGNAVVNPDGLAQDLIIYGTTNVTSISLSGNGQFTGMLIAPSANFSLSGGGNNTTDFIGMMLVNSVTLNGHFNVHYDEALSRLGASGRYLISSWDEINP